MISELKSRFANVRTNSNTELAGVCAAGAYLHNGNGEVEPPPSGGLLEMDNQTLADRTSDVMGQIVATSGCLCLLTGCVRAGECLVVHQWRTGEQVEAMNLEDVRNTLIIELSHSFLQRLTNDALANTCQYNGLRLVPPLGNAHA